MYHTLSVVLEVELNRILKIPRSLLGNKMCITFPANWDTWHTVDSVAIPLMIMIDHYMYCVLDCLHTRAQSEMNRRNLGESLIEVTGWQCWAALQLARPIYIRGRPTAIRHAVREKYREQSGFTAAATIRVSGTDQLIDGLKLPVG